MHPKCPPAKLLSKPTNTYSLAHTAQCKLHIAANRPDRNLRFVLGHAFTLDNVLLRIVEIENSGARDDFAASQPKPTPAGKTGDLGNRRVSFSDNNARPSVTTPTHTGNAANARRRATSPPPKALNKVKPPTYNDDDDDTSSDDYDDDADAEALAGELDDGLSLTRFQSATAEPPRMVPSDDSDSESDDEGPASPPPTLPADVDVREIMAGEVDEELGAIYESIRGCQCHGRHEEEGVKSAGMWDVPVTSKEGDEKGELGGGLGRLAVMRVGQTAAA